MTAAQERRGFVEELFIELARAEAELGRLTDELELAQLSVERQQRRRDLLAEYVAMRQEDGSE